MGTGKTSVSIVYSILVTIALVGFPDLARGQDCDWSHDPRSLALTAEGLEGLLPRSPEQPNMDGFGELLGEWTWPDLGIPGDWAGAGVSIDYPYLYLSNQDYHRVYVLDISAGVPNPLLWFDAPGIGRWTWGLGMDNEQELWVGEVYVYDPLRSWVYEMTTYPPMPEATGNNFDCRQGVGWKADITDNVPHDTIYMVRVGWPNRNIFAFHEPTGTIGREIGNPAWNYVSQRALTYNEDNGTLFVGGWNSDSMWEISLADGAPLPGRSFYAKSAAGAAYQTKAFGGPCLWVQSNEQIDVLRKYRVGPVDACDLVEPWHVRSQGYWRRHCKDDGHEDICTYVDNIQGLADLFDAFNCDSICDLMNVNPPENDMCRKAMRQFMALLLNVASGKLAVCNCLEGGLEVDDAISEIDSLLSGDLDFHTCVYAKTLADDINNGLGIVPCDTFLLSLSAEPIAVPSCFVVPNPCAGSAEIQYRLADCEPVKLEVFDESGRVVAKLRDCHQAAGFHHSVWDGRDQAGDVVPDAVYFARIQVGGRVSAAKFVLVR